MTRDDIEKKAKELFEMVAYEDGTKEDDQERIAQAIREAVIEAYEECAKVADGWDMGAPIARDIRALKDSLNEPTAHSPSHPTVRLS